MDPRCVNCLKLGIGCSCSPLWHGGGHEALQDATLGPYLVKNKVQFKNTRALRDGVDTGRVQEKAGGFGDAANTRRAPHPLPFRVVEGLEL